MFQAMGMQQGGIASALPRNQHLSVASMRAIRPVVFKRRAVEEAENQQKVIEEKLRKLGMPTSDYEFKELIGKGAYGRVYKSLNRRTGDIVAVKVLETDSMDFESTGPNKDASMEDALKEINILQRLRESKAVNVNLFYEAFQVHSQLWIVSEYCPGGSVTTLRRATGNKLEERHIIAIARELAKGLKSVHDAGIVHRDIKCSNVLISETGRVQIIDFGVAGVLLSNLDDDKRKTVIGTPHWMAPEMQKNTAEIAHAFEVDCWAYGITLYECAMGAPPNADIMPGRQLQSKIRQESPPRLPSGGRFSQGLQDLVAFVLEPVPKMRPSMERICQQAFLADSEKQYPTSSLAELVQKFYFWEHSGGSRASLFMEGGAAKPQLAPTQKDDDEEWNFSLTANFEKKQQKEIIRLSMMDPNNNLDAAAFADMLANSPPADVDEFELVDQPTARSFAGEHGKSKSDVDNESRVARGARAMQGLFDETAEPYKYGYGPNDLPLRSGESSDSLHRKEVSVGSANGVQQIDLKNAPKGRQNRATMNWKWEENLGASTTNTATIPEITTYTTPPRPALKQNAIEPPTFSERPMSETLDLDAMMGDDTFTLSRGDHPWSAAASTMPSSAPSVVGDDQEEEDDGMINLDIGDTMKPSFYNLGPNTMLHAKKESESSLSLPPPSANSTLGSSTSFPTGTTAVTATGYPPALQTLRPNMVPSIGEAEFPWPQAVDSTALIYGSPEELLVSSLEKTLQGWISGLESLEEMYGEMAAGEDIPDETERKSADAAQLQHPRVSRQASISSLSEFSGPGEDVGEYVEEDRTDNSSFDGDAEQEHDADGEGDEISTKGRRW